MRWWSLSGFLEGYVEGDIKEGGGGRMFFWEFLGFWYGKGYIEGKMGVGEVGWGVFLGR